MERGGENPINSFYCDVGRGFISYWIDVCIGSFLSCISFFFLFFWMMISFFFFACRLPGSVRSFFDSVASSRRYFRVGFASVRFRV